MRPAGPARRARRSAVAALAACVLAACSAGGAGQGSDSAVTAPTTSTAPDLGSVTVVEATTSSTTTEAVPTTAVPTTVVAPPYVTAPGLPALPGQPADVPFPDSDWPTGDLPDSVDVRALDQATDAAFGSEPGKRVKSLLVVSGGRIVYERYHDPVTATDIADSFSVSKSFTSAVIGLLTGDGKLAVTDRAARPEWSDSADPRHEITVADLLHMASGLEWSEGTVDYPPFFGAPSGAGYAASKPLAAPPNSVFNYSTGTTAILASLAADVLGGPDELEAYLRSRLLDPIGITSTQLLKDPSGMWYGGLGANSTPRDFARFGLLFLRDGVWDGQRVLPEGWVDYTRTPSDANPRYGAQWWIGPDHAFFEARGLGGQRIRVIPEVDAVVVITTQFDEPAAEELATRVTELLLGT